MGEVDLKDGLTGVIYRSSAEWLLTGDCYFLRNRKYLSAFIPVLTSAKVFLRIVAIDV